jgi:hypothetical protein
MNSANKIIKSLAGALKTQSHHNRESKDTAFCKSKLRARSSMIGSPIYFPKALMHDRFLKKKINIKYLNELIKLRQINWLKKAPEI